MFPVNGDEWDGVQLQYSSGCGCEPKQKVLEKDNTEWFSIALFLIPNCWRSLELPGEEFVLCLGFRRTRFLTPANL